MSTSQSSLDAAAAQRKAHLASLRNKFLKRKNPDEDEEIITNEATGDGDDVVAKADVTKLYLSGRNYDAETKGPKLGFETAPSADVETAEDRSKALLDETKAKQAEEQEEKPLDLFALQPKKPNWDLKREVDEKLKILGVRTDNAIARLVRDRITAAQRKDGDTVGMEGVNLVEGVHRREREDENEEDQL